MSHKAAMPGMTPNPADEASTAMMSAGVTIASQTAKSRMAAILAERREES